ncbi:MULTISPECIES: K(+)-transporting ATPase subunit F [Glutamicibacter]|nr:MULTISPECIES: K(+)-transporting ATPase subunit F [Glutamicibacter]
MLVINIVSAVIGTAAVGYLIAALLKPERI